MSGLHQRSRAGAGFHHPGVPQPFIQTLALQTTPLREGSKSCFRRDAKVAITSRCLVLAAGGELVFQRRQFGERRVGVDRAVAFARAGAGGVLPMRRSAVGPLVTSALVAPALVAAAFITRSLVAPAAEFRLVLVALETLTRLMRPLIAARFARRSAFGNWGRCALRRRIRAGLAELVVTPASSGPVGLGGVAGLACRGGGRSALRRAVMAMAVAIVTVTRPPIFGAARRSPYLDHFRRSRLGHNGGGSIRPGGIGGSGVAWSLGGITGSSGA